MFPQDEKIDIQLVDYEFFYFFLVMEGEIF